MANSQMGAALVALFNTIRSGLPNATVLLGQGASADPGQSGLVLVGCDDADGEGYTSVISGDQKWAQLGGLRRDEDFTIHSVAVAWNGDGDTQRSVTDAFALMASVESAIVSDPTLGGALLYAPGISTVSVKQISDKQGTATHIGFDLHCRTRI